MEKKSRKVSVQEIQDAWETCQAKERYLIAAKREYTKAVKEFNTLTIRTGPKTLAEFVRHGDFFLEDELLK